MRRASRIAGIFSELTLAVLCLLFVLEVLLRATSLPDMSRLRSKSQLVTSSSGDVLWGFLSRDERWRFSATEREVDPRFLRLLVKFEDKRFWMHPGVDPIAIGRAVAETL